MRDPFNRLIDVLAECIVEDYLTEQANVRAANDGERVERAPLSDMGEAA